LSDPRVWSEAGEGNAMDVQVVEIAAGVWHARAKHVGWVLVSEGDQVTLRRGTR